jgi:hypothetical protein
MYGTLGLRLVESIPWSLTWLDMFFKSLLAISLLMYHSLRKAAVMSERVNSSTDKVEFLGH